MRKILLILLLFVGLINRGLAQEKIILGTITSAEDSSPMPFVNILVKGTTKGASTDIDGKYKIYGISEKDTLIFRFVGYEPQIIYVGMQSIINVELKLSLNVLDEVVVTALGVKRQSRVIGYSTEKVAGEDLLKSNASNVISALTGKSAGVQIQNPNGVDGGTTKINIRGNNNITGNNQPLIVIDNIPIDNTPGLTSIKNGTDWGSAINNINPQDIEEINVLKGGAASSLYGSRGANGVIIITTKKGKKQTGLGVEYNMFYKISNPYRFREVQNVYGGGAPVSFTTPTFPLDQNGNFLYPKLDNGGSIILDSSGATALIADEFGYFGSGVSWGPKMEGQTIKWWDGQMRSWSPQPDNLKKFFNNGYTKTHNVTISGGNDKGTMRLSLTRMDNKPVIDNANINQTTVNVASNVKITEKITIGISASYVNYHRLNSPMLGDDENSIGKGLLYSWPRSYQGEDKLEYEFPDGSRDTILDDSPFKYISKYLWWNYYNNNVTLDRNNIIGGVFLNYEITKWLSFTGRTGIDFSYEQYESKNKPVDVIGLLNGYYSKTTNRHNNNTSEFFFTASEDSIFNSKINIKFTTGASSYYGNYYKISASSGTWSLPNTYSLQNYSPTDDPSTLIAKEGYIRKKINSFVSFLNLSYSNYVFMDITGRNDWSSTLDANNNSYLYPGISLSFIPTDAFNIQSKWLSFWKIRGSVSQTATDAEPYATQFYYTTSLFGGQQSSIFPDVIPPVNLKPQRVNTYEAGTIIDLLKGRINIDFTYYYAYCFDQILRLPVPNSAGAPYAIINDGVLTNKGIEFILNTSPIQKKDFKFNTGLSYSRNRNRVISLGENNDTYIMAELWGQWGPAVELKKGDLFGTIYGYDYIYKDGKPVVNDQGTKYLITDKRVPIGNSSPKFLASWTTQFKYKNFTLSSLIDGKFGGDIYCGSYVVSLQNGQSPETLLERDGGGLPYTDPEGNTSNIGVILDGVHEDGTANTTVVHYYYKYMPNAGGWGKVLSTPGVMENTWVKLREVTLTYRLPPQFYGKFKFFKELSILLTGRDLCYLYTTLPDKINPEGTAGTSDASQAFEWASMPGIRSYSFGINAKF